MLPRFRKSKKKTKKNDPNRKAKEKLGKTIEHQINRGTSIGRIISSLEKKKDQASTQMGKIQKKLKISSPEFDQTLNAHRAQMDWVQYIDTEIGRLQSLMAERNKKARRLEQAGRIEPAIPLYETNVKDQFEGTLPYNRLRIIYTRQKQYTDAIRVCNAYLNLPGRSHGQSKPQFRQHLKKLQQRKK